MTCFPRQGKQLLDRLLLKLTESRKLAAEAAYCVLSSQIETDNLWLGHLLKGEIDSLPPQARSFDAAKGHGIDAIIATVVYHHPPAQEFIYRLKGCLYTLGENPGLQPIVNSIRTLNRLFKRVKLKEHGDWPIDFLRCERRSIRNVLQQGWQIIGPGALRSDKRFCPCCKSLVDSLFYTHCCRLIDEWTHVGLLILLIPGSIRLRQGQKAFNTLGYNRPLNKETLYMQAVLPGSPIWDPNIFSPRFPL